MQKPQSAIYLSESREGGVEGGCTASMEPRLVAQNSLGALHWLAGWCWNFASAEGAMEGGSLDDGRVVIQSPARSAKPQRKGTARPTAAAAQRLSQLRQGCHPAPCKREWVAAAGQTWLSAVFWEYIAGDKDEHIVEGVVEHGTKGGEGNGGARSGEGTSAQAIFHGDNTYHACVLGQVVGSDSQLVMFKGHEDDGWQETLRKDIRFEAEGLQLGRGKKGKKEGAGKGGGNGRDDSAVSAGAEEVSEKVSKSDGRSGKKWEVVSSFMGIALGGDTTKKAAGKSGKLALSQAEASTTSDKKSDESNAVTTRATDMVVSALQEVADSGAAAVHDGPYAGDAPGEDRDELGVSYDLLTSVSERLEDLDLFEAVQAGAPLPAPSRPSCVGA
jgi:hypothetical protein